MRDDKVMRIAMIAPPWLPIPPIGYGGIENVLAVLVPGLINLGVEVELFTIGETTLKANKNHYLYESGQYHFIHRPIYESLPIIAAHTAFALNKIEQDGKFDLIHCHNGFIGPFVTAFCRDNMPPTLHTLHGPPFSDSERINQAGLPDNLPMWNQLSKANKLYIVGISEALMRPAPKKLKKRILEPVYNSIDTSQFTYSNKKSEYFVTLARSHPDKGQGIAAKICANKGYKLKLAGLIDDMTTSKQVMMELANPLSKYRGSIGFKYFSDEVFPHLEHGQIDYVGDVSGQRKIDLLMRAKALLFPIQWNEPFGMAPIEALACGTPVIAMARGALPEIIEHGVNGFLANNEKEFADYMDRIDEIDPAACRKSVEAKFSAQHMAKEYLKRYQEIIKKESSK